MSDAADLTELLSNCEAVIGYRFNDRTILERCLTHSSIAKTRLHSNERLEFFGDAILGAVISETLFHRFPTYPEGELTRLKSTLVSRNTCAEVAEGIGLKRFLLLGKGLTSFDTIPASILSAAVESLVAGVYLDGGLEAARQFVIRCFGAQLEKTTGVEHGKNYKSLLQQFSQKRFGETPVYRLLDEKGPDHSKCFEVSAVIGEKVYPSAWGPNKKEAEQQAACNALQALQEEDVGYVPD
jgi:ribonuclease-3